MMREKMITVRRLMIALIGVLTVVSVGCRGDRSELPPVHLNPNMDQQKKLDPQETERLFKNNMAMLRPVKGTVAIGHLKTDDHLHKGLVAPETFAKRLPLQIKLDTALVKRGEERYQIFCTPCHDSLGTGNGTIFKRRAGLPAPANLHQNRLLAAPIGYLYHVITDGKSNMQPFKAQIPTRDRWAIAVYVRALQLSQHPTIQK